MMAIPGFTGTTLKTGSPTAGPAIDQDGAPADEFAALFAASMTDVNDASPEVPETNLPATSPADKCDFLSDLSTDNTTVQSTVIKMLSVTPGEAIPSGADQVTPDEGIASQIPVFGSETKADSPASGKDVLPAQPDTEKARAEPAVEVPASLILPVAFVPATIQVSEVAVPVEANRNTTTEASGDVSRTAQAEAPIRASNETSRIAQTELPMKASDEASRTAPREVASESAVESLTNRAGKDTDSAANFTVRTKEILSQPPTQPEAPKGDIPAVKVDGSPVKSLEPSVTNPVKETRAEDSRSTGLTSVVAGDDSTKTKTISEPSEKANVVISTARNTQAENPANRMVASVASSIPAQTISQVNGSDYTGYVLPSGIAVTSIEVADRKPAISNFQEIPNAAVPATPSQESGYQRISEAIRSLKSSPVTNNDDSSAALPESAGEGKRLPAMSTNGDPVHSDPVTGRQTDQPSGTSAATVQVKTDRIVSATTPVSIPVTPGKASTRGTNSRSTEARADEIPDRINTEPTDGTVTGLDKSAANVTEPVLSLTDKTFRFRKDPLTWSAKPGTEREAGKDKTIARTAAGSGESAEKQVERVATTSRPGGVVERPAAKATDSESSEVKAKPDDAGGFANTLTAANGTQQPGRETSRTEVQTPSVQVAAKIIDTTATLHRGETKSIKVSLSPEKLGRVDVEVRRDADGRVTATLTADRTEAARAISEGIPGLRQHLEQNGVSVANLDVQTAGSQTQGNLTNNSNNPHNPQQEVIRNPELSGAGPIGTEGQDPTKEDRLLNVLA